MTGDLKKKKKKIHGVGSKTAGFCRCCYRIPLWNSTHLFPHAWLPDLCLKFSLSSLSQTRQKRRFWELPLGFVYFNSPYTWTEQRDQGLSHSISELKKWSPSPIFCPKNMKTRNDMPGLFWGSKSGEKRSIRNIPDVSGLGDGCPAAAIGLGLQGECRVGRLLFWQRCLLVVRETLDQE